MKPVSRRIHAGGKTAEGHPAAGLAIVVFEVCCRTLAALREGWKGPLPEPSEPDPDFEEHLAFLSRKSGAAEGESAGTILPACPSWKTLVEQTTDPDPVKDRRVELTDEQKSRILKLAYQDPGKLYGVILDLAAEMAAEPDAAGLILTETARPFPVATVVGWLDELGLIEQVDGKLRAKPSCFGSVSRFDNLKIASKAFIRIRDWVLGETAPPGRALPIRLRGADGKPGFVNAILLAQGIRNPDDAVAALLDVIPGWSPERRAAFEDLIVGWWVRRADRNDRPPGWRSKSAALYLDRWRGVLKRHGVSDKASEPVVIDPRRRVPAPREFVRRIGEHVIGQAEAKRAVATAIHYQVLSRFQDGESDSMGGPPPAPLLLAGPTGCGKSLLVSTACRLAGLPFLHIDTSQMVPEGIVGRSVNDIGRQLIVDHGDGAEGIARARRAVLFFDEIDKLTGTQYGADVISQLLTLLEGGSIHLTETMHRAWKPPASSLSCGNMFFILGGAFQPLFDRAGKATIGFGGNSATASSIGLDDLARAGFPREFLGRIHRWVVMPPLTEDQLQIILTRSKSSPLAAANELLALHDFRLTLSQASTRRIASAAMRSGYGARALHQIVHEIAEPWMFDAPGRSGKTHRVSVREVEAALGRLDAKGAFGAPNP